MIYFYLYLSKKMEMIFYNDGLLLISLYTKPQRLSVFHIKSEGSKNWCLKVLFTNKIFLMEIPFKYLYFVIKIKISYIPI